MSNPKDLAKKHNIPHDELLAAIEADLGEPDKSVLTAEQAVEAMRRGMRVDKWSDDGTFCWYMDGNGAIAYDGDDLSCSKSGWLGVPRAGTFTTHGYHPKAARYATQRLVAAGCKVGSRVRVTRVAETGDGGSVYGWSPSMSVGEYVVSSVVTPYGFGMSQATGDEFRYPGHVIELIEADPKPEFKVGNDTNVHSPTNKSNEVPKNFNTHNNNDE